MRASEALGIAAAAAEKARQNQGYDIRPFLEIAFEKIKQAASEQRTEIQNIFDGVRCGITWDQERKVYDHLKSIGYTCLPEGRHVIVSWAEPTK